MHRTIKLLIFSDIFVVTGWGLIAPILAIFIKDNLVGGSIVAAGLASTIFIITRCSLQIPLSRYIDSHKHKAIFLIVGGCIAATIPFIYAHITHIHHLYLAQAWHGIGAAFAYPAWLSLFSTHLDKRKEGFEWAVYGSAVGFGTAGAAFLGAALADLFGFRTVFFIVGALTIIGVSILFKLEKIHLKRPKLFAAGYKEKLLGRHGPYGYHYH